MIKNRIHLYRLRLHLTQSELAELIGCSKNSISLFERGEFNPGLKTIFSLLNIFQCKFEDLFYERRCD